MRVPAPLRLVSLLVLLASLLFVPPAAAAEFDVEVDDFFFAPDELYVNVGDTVNWAWVGEQPHNVTPVEDGAFEPSPTQSEGTHSVTFEEEGTVPYRCTLHSSPDGTEGHVGVVNVLAQGEPLPEPAPDPRPAPEPGQLPTAEDAVGTALAWSALFADGSAPTVALGRTDAFADALTSGAVQGLVDGPLLLTPTDELDQRVIDELARLGATRVIIFGGETAISAEVEARLRELVETVDRVQGVTRIETANAAAETFFPDATEALLVRSDGTPGGDPTQGFADSLSVGGAAAREVIPILLSETAQLSTTTRAYLEQSQITRIYVVGGTAALSDQVVADLEAMQMEVVRLAGDTRFDTALEVVFQFFGGPPDVAILIEGQAADAWVAGFTAASAAESAPILLANGEQLPAATLDVLIEGTPVLCAPGVNPTACERADIAASAAPFGSPGTLLAQMSGDQEVPGPGHETALGDFALLPTQADDAVCYEIAFYDLDEPLTGAHIHTGATGEAGDVVIPLQTPAAGEDFLRTCSFGLDPAAVADVLASPAAYYVNYHTETFPGGAVRGQLFRPELIGGAELNAESEVPPSEALGGGFIFLTTDADDHSRICYYMGFGVEDETPTAAHIHEGAEGENGPPVVTLELPPSDGEGGFEGTLCVEDLDPALVEDIVASPGDHYVNVHTETHPDGAIRGQIFPFGPPPADGEGPPPEFAAARR